MECSTDSLIYLVYVWIDGVLSERRHLLKG